MGDVRDTMYRMVEERDIKINHRCVLCAVGFPRGTHYGTEHHEIISKAKLRGKKNLEKLYALPNIAMTCQYHHHHFQYLPIVWMKSMVKLGLATVADYKEDPNWLDFYPPFDCFGSFGKGNKYYKEIGEVPTTVTMAIVGSGNKTKNFCRDICPFWDKCILESRKKYLSEK